MKQEPNTPSIEESTLMVDESSFDNTEYEKVIEFLREENEKRTTYFSLNAIGGWNESDFGDHFFGQP